MDILIDILIIIFYPLIVTVDNFCLKIYRFIFKQK